MADRIKGITVEINGDTSKLSDALRGVDKSLKETQKQLKDVNSALKLDPKNVDLLKQKQQLLTKSIGDTEQRLKILKQAQEQAAQEMENGSEEARKNYDKLTIEISKTTTQLKGLQTQSENTNKALDEADKGKLSNLRDGLDKVADGANKAGEKISGIGKMATVASGLIVAMAGAAVEAFKEVDAGADTIIKKTGATGARAEALQKVYEEVASSMGVSFADAGAAVGEISTRFGLTGDGLRDLSTEFLKFADINGQDVTAAITGVDKAIKLFGVDSKETKNVLGLLTKTGQNTGIAVDTLESLLQSNGVALMEMGLGLGESVQLMGALEQSGADASQVMAGLKKAATEYSKSGQDMSTELSGLIERLKDSGTEAEATEEAYKIFGSRAGLAFISLAKQGKLSLSGLSTDFSEYGSVVSDTYEATLDGIDKLDITTNKTKIALGKLGASISDGVAPVLEEVNGLIEKLTGWLDSLSTEEKTQIVRIGGILAAAGPVTVVVGKIISGVATAAKTIASWANPLTVSLSIIGALGIAVGNAVEEIHQADLAAYGWDEEMKALGRSIDENSAKMDALVTSSREESNAIGENREKAAFLWDQLQLIVDKNGEVKEGYEKQAEILTDQISKELGLQLQIIGGQIQGYKDVASAIDTIIEKKTIEALLDANRDEWLEAKQKEGEIDAELVKVTEERSEAEQKLAEARAEYNKAVEEGASFVNEYGEYSAATMMGVIDEGELGAKLDAAQEAFDNIEEKYNAAVGAYGKNQAILQGYNALMTASVSDDAKVMKEASDSFLATLNGNEEDFRQNGFDIINDTTATVLGAKRVLDENAYGVQRSVERMLNPVNQLLDETIAKMTQVGAAMSGGMNSSVVVTNNNTLTLDGQVVARSVDKSIGRWSD